MGGFFFFGEDFVWLLKMMKQGRQSTCMAEAAPRSRTLLHLFTSCGTRVEAWDSLRELVLPFDHVGLSDHLGWLGSVV